jgi:nicotinamide riboside transporter PnuC
VEFFGVAISILSNWMDAFKYKTNWIGWTLTNGLFGYLFFEGHLWGPFAMTFLFQALCCVGFYRWYKEEKKLVAEGKVVRVGGAQYA